MINTTGGALILIARLMSRTRGARALHNWPEGLPGPGAEGCERLWSALASPAQAAPVTRLRGARNGYFRPLALFRAGAFLVLSGEEIDGQDFDQVRGSLYLVALD